MSKLSFIFSKKPRYVFLIVVELFLSDLDILSILSKIVESLTFNNLFTNTPVKLYRSVQSQ